MRNPIKRLSGIETAVTSDARKAIRKKKTTMMNMANVINEFLAAVSRGFTDTAFIDVPQTRSTERRDIEQEFVSVGE